MIVKLIILALVTAALGACAAEIASVGQLQIDSQDRVAASEIMGKLQNGKPVDYDGVVIEGNLDLSQASLNKTPLNHNHRWQVLLGRDESSDIVVSPIRITNSVVRGNVNFQYAILKGFINFENTTFQRTVNFKLTQFENISRLHRATFDSNVFLDGAAFNREVDFSETRFSRPASLLWTEFRGNGDFQYSHFENRADFRNTIFNGSVNFWGSRFDKSVLFSEALFAREAYFNEVHLLQEANFGLARFERTALFEYAQFGGYSDFRWVQFLGDAGFKKAHFMGPVDFRDSRFRSDADFRGCRFDVDFDIRGIEFSKMLVEWNAIRDQLVCEGRVYLDLIRNFKSQERFEDANGCYYQYRQQRMEQRSWEDINKYLDILGWLTCGFGVRPDYTIISIVSMIVVFGGLYWRMDIFRDISPSIQSIDHKGDRTRLIDALFFSTVLFFTMPPPIICISQRSRYLILVEDILGWLLMTLFIVTLVNVMIS